jgi:hypothetical protein
MKNIAFFTWITNSHKNTLVDFNGFYKSFKCFHPDIDLIVFEQDIIDKLRNQKPWLTTTNCKASFAKLLYNDYETVVNVDSDFYFLGRCHEILEQNYDIAACANYNIVLNTTLKEQTLLNKKINFVDEVRYVQGGLIAGKNKNFWDEYEALSEEISHLLPTYENDVLNILWHSGRYQTKILDGDYDFNSPNFNCYYNCSSLGRLSQCMLIDDGVYLDNKPMRSYHVAFGWHSMKPRFSQLFPHHISRWFYNKIG